MTAKKLIVVCGTTGNQGGFGVAKLLLRYRNQYVVRALTRGPTSAPAQALMKLGTDVVRVNLAVPTDINEALQGCWDVFGVTNFSDPKIKHNPKSEEKQKEKQSKNLVDDALAACVRCLGWSTVPSSGILSRGRLEKDPSAIAKAALDH